MKKDKRVRIRLRNAANLQKSYGYSYDLNRAVARAKELSDDGYTMVVFRVGGVPSQVWFAAKEK